MKALASDEYGLLIDPSASIAVAHATGGIEILSPISTIAMGA